MTRRPGAYRQDEQDAQAGIGCGFMMAAAAVFLVFLAACLTL